jgi:hypothetical protein
MRCSLLSGSAYLLFSAASLLAQSPLTTGYASNNGGAVGGQVFFDLQVATTITLQGFDLNIDQSPGTIGTIEVYTRNGTYLGNELNAAAWSSTPVASGSITAAGRDLPSPVCFGTPLTLTPGLVGVAVRYIGVSANYTNGTGTVVPGGGGAATNQTIVRNEVTLLAGAAQSPPWTQSFQPRVWSGSLNYVVGASGLPCSAAPASHTDYGPGCYRFQGSFYDGFDAAGASSTLSGRVLSMVLGGSGYVVLPALTGVAFVPPTAAATVLTGFVPDNDDGERAVTLPSAFPLPAGSVTQLFVHTNGIVSTGANHPTLPNPNYFPTTAGLLGQPNAAWYSWHDYNPSEPNSGQIKTETVGTLFCITWDGVESYDLNQVNPSTFQLQFDLGTGQVNYVWQNITAINAGAASDVHLIGYSPGGPSVDHGEQDVAAIVTLTLDANRDALPLTLRASTRPVLGHTISYTTSSETTTPGIGLNLLSLADLGALSPAGLDLGILGAPECVANVDLGQGVGNVIGNFGSLSMTISLPVPVNATLSGLQLFSQSVWLDAAANSAGLLTSNAVRTQLGTF